MMRDLAAALAAQGFRVVPVANKAPIADGFGAKFPDYSCPLDSELWDRAEKVGVLGGPCPALAEWDLHLLVVDLDGDWESVPAIREWVESLPDTLTSHGGTHLFFGVPPEYHDKLGGWTDCFKTKASAGAAVDLRWAGGQASEDGDWVGADGGSLVDAIAELDAEHLEDLLARRLRARAESASAAGGAARSCGVIEDRPEWWEADQQEVFARRWAAGRAPVSVSGEGGHDAALVTAGGLLVGFGLDEDVAMLVLEEEWNERCDPEWPTDALLHKLREVDIKGSESFEWLELARMMLDLEALVPAPVEAPGADDPAPDPARVAEWPPDRPLPAPREEPPLPGTGTGVDDFGGDRADASRLTLCPLTGWPYLLQQGNQFWAHSPGRASYSNAFPQAELRVRVLRTLHESIPPEHAKKTTLEESYIRQVEDVAWSYTARWNTYDPRANGGAGRLTCASLNWHTGGARFHPGVDRWLRALFREEDFVEAMRWLVSCLHLDRPAPCLYLVGPPGVGKGLLADGLAQLWGKTRPSSLRACLTDFNSFMAHCPLVLADEGFPDKMNFDWFREAITTRSQEVNEKNVPKYFVEGCARYIVAANDDQGLRFQRTGSLSTQGIKAIAERLLVLELQEGARAIADAQDTDDMAHFQIAEHVRWLDTQEEYRAVEGQRLATGAGGGTELLEEIATNRYDAILMFLEPYIEEAAAANAKTAEGYDKAPFVYVDPQREGVLALSLKYAMERIKASDGGVPIRMADLKAFCATYQMEKGSFQYRVGFGREGSRLKMRRLDLAAIERALARLD